MLKLRKEGFSQANVVRMMVSVKTSSFVDN